MNLVVLYGRMVQTPELKSGSTGKDYCRFSVAVERAFSKEKKADFFDVVAFDRQANTVCRFFKKGSPILFTGRLEQDVFETKEGKKSSAVKIRLNDLYFTGQKSDGEKPATEKKADDRSSEFMDIPEDASSAFLPFT